MNQRKQYQQKWWKTTGKNNFYQRKFGISIDDYNHLFVKQEGKCAICGRHQSELTNALNVDHCHSTGKVRGLLCWDCNTAIGKLRDDITLLQKAIDYLK